MHNTLIPLDMIFIRRDLTIAGIVASAEPQTDTLRKVARYGKYDKRRGGRRVAPAGARKSVAPTHTCQETEALTRN